MQYKDYYAALGVPRDADLAQIKKAYRTLARQYHPDVSKAPDAESRFKDAAEAYATLKDPGRRAHYDELGTQTAGEEMRPPPQWHREAGANSPAFDGMDLADLLASLGRGFGKSRSGPVPMQGRDLESTVQISLQDAYRGTKLQLDLGTADSTHHLEVTLPAGMVDGQRIRLRGRGGKGRNGGADGDVYLQVLLLPDAVFRTDGPDLYFDLVLAPWEAALGAELEVSTLDGAVLLTVPPGTSSGRKLRLRGRGLGRSSDLRGDLYALVAIVVPATLTVQERELFEQLGRISAFQPRSVRKPENLHASATP